METFLAEAHRTLKRGGVLVLADLRWDIRVNGSQEPAGLTRLRQQLAQSDLLVIRESDLTSGVVRARTAADNTQRTAIRRYVPRGLRRAFTELSALPGSTMYQHLEMRRLVYWSCLLQKPTHVD
jgi:hypothetical protein